jgi:hypothetical protein
MLAVRISFLVVVVLMLVFGLAPIPQATARLGIIATVVALMMLGLFSAILDVL